MVSILIIGSSKARGVTHPFLVTSTGDYANMVSSSASPPWSLIKAEALAFLAGPLGTYSASGSSQDNCNQVAQLMGVNALLYTLNTGNSGSITYRNNIKGMLDAFQALWNSEIPNYGTYEADVPLNGAFFSSVIALDVIYPDLTAGQRTTYETLFSSYSQWNRGQPTSWAMSNYGASAIWSLFMSTNTALVQADTEAYHNGFFYPGDSFSWLNSGGGFGGGSEYGWARIGGASLEKIAKWGFKYVAEHTGADPIFDNSALKNYFEWQYSGLINPFNWHVVFGDSNHHHELGYNYWYAAAISSYTITSSDLTVGNWSTRAAGWAGRFASLAGPLQYPDSLIVYCAATGPLSVSTPSVSVVFPMQGAAFWDSVDQSTSALQGVLWNVKTTRYDHIHKEQNNLYLAGYGEVLLAGPGYFFGSSVHGFPESWSNDYAPSHNVALIGDKDHDSMVRADLLHAKTGGDGVTEYLLSNDYFDYASGYSTTSYNGMGTHTRNFLFIHPSDGAPGYWATLDDIHSSTYSFVNVVWHPYALNFTTTTASKEWAWPIADHNTSSTTLNVFLGTPATSVSFSSGVFSSRGGGTDLGMYLNAKYNVDASSDVRAVTVLYPSNATHTKATFQQLVTSLSSGAMVSNGDTQDFILMSTPSVLAGGGVTGDVYRGRGAFFRYVDAALKSWFVRQGTEFSSNEIPTKGFTSTAPISIYVRDTSGSVYAPSDTSATFYYPDISGVSQDGVALSGTLGTDSFTTTVASGNHTISIETVSDSRNIQLRGSAILRGSVIMR